MLLVQSCLSILSWFRCHQKVIYICNLNEYKMPNPDHSFGMTIYWYLGALFWITILNISTTWISWLQSPSEVILESKKVKSVTVSIVSPSICMKWWGQMPWYSFFKCWVLSQLFTLLFYFHQQALQFFIFCYKGGIICVSEVIDISPGNLDSSLCFIQPSISHLVLCIKLDSAAMKLKDACSLEEKQWQT